MPADRGLHAGGEEGAKLEYLLVCIASIWECVKDAKGAPRTVANMRIPLSVQFTTAYMLSQERRSSRQNRSTSVEP